MSLRCEIRLSDILIFDIVKKCKKKKGRNFI